MTDETAVVAPQSYESRMVKFKEAWERSMPYIKALVPAHVNPERIFSIAVTARQRNPKLLECTDISVLRGIIIGAQLGLDVSGVNGKAYLVPFWNKNTKQLEAQFIAGYRGLMELARRSGQVAAFYGRVVYLGEDFEYEDGLNQRLHHVPSIGAGDPGVVRGAWVIAVLANGFRQMQVLSSWQIEKIRKSSKAADDGPWVNWYEEMCLKSALKRMIKLLPDSVELNRAIALEDAAESGDPIIDVEIPDSEARQLPAPTRTEQIKEQISKGKYPDVRIVEEDHSAAAPPAKRGPGRPPKPKAPEPMGAIAELAETDEETTPAETDDAYDAD